MIDMKSHMKHLMFNVTSIAKLSIAILVLLCLSQEKASATHIVGGNLTYRCLGPNQFGVNSYEIRLTVRRDCFLGAGNAPFDDPASVGFYDGLTFQRATVVGINGELRMNLNHLDTLNEILVSDCSVVSGDVCVHTTTYVDTILLPYNAHGYIMAYQRCCRNMSITNLVDPDNTGMTLVAELSALAQQECNSSPQFNAFPPIYVCVNKPIEFASFAVDAENDSLVYSLCVPNGGGDKIFNMPQPPPNPPYVPVVYRPPYSLANLMGGVPLAINPITGMLTGTPNTIGQFVVGICVTAYDRETKMLTGVTRRDFQFNVRQCRDVPVAAFTAPTLNCETLTVTFDNQSILSDEYRWIFDYNDPDSPMSTEFEPTFTYDHSGFYNVALITSDSNNFCYDTIIHQIGVFNENIIADFTYDVSSCTTDGIVLNVTDQSSGFGVNYPACDFEWLLTMDNCVIPSTDQNPTFTCDIDGTATAFLAYIVTSCNGCSASEAKSFPVHEITIDLNPLADSICFGDTAILLLNCDTTTFDYIWGPGNGLDPTGSPDGCAIAYPGVSSDYNLTVTDGLCEVTGSTHVEVQQLPVLAFDYETDCKSLQVDFDNNSTGGFAFMWDFGDPNITTDVSTLPNPSYVYHQPGKYIVTLKSADGCDVSTSLMITSNAITDSLGNTVLSCFNEPVELNPVFGPYTYTWSPSQFLNPPDGPNPIATVTANTTFYVTISQAGLEGCEIVDSILVLAPEDFTVNAGADDTICNFSDVILTGTTTINPLNVSWINEEGDTISHAKIVTVPAPDSTRTYTFVGVNEFGCTTSDQVTIYRPDTLTPCLVSENMTYCNQQAFILEACPVPGLTYQWFNSSGELIGEGLTVPVAPHDPACYEIIATDQIGCQGNEIICLTPTYFDLDITSSQSVCLGEEPTITVTDHNNQDLNYTWAPSELIGSGQGTSSVVVHPTDTTTFSVIVENDDLGCLDTLYSEVVVNLFEPINVIITADPDTITLTHSTVLTVNQDPGFLYEWSSNPPQDPIPPIYNPTVTPDTEGDITYTVTVTNDAGCTDVASVSIHVRNPNCDESDIFLPNAFSPDGDHENNILCVRSQFVSSMELHIYSRWGQEVFSSTDQSICWDGTFKGKKLEPDVFGYYLSVVCPNQATYKTQGNVTILK